MTVEERRRRRFSEAFRKEQVALIESGKVTIQEVSRMYEVKAQNVRRWLHKYGTKELPKPIVVQSSRDIDRLRELEEENARLKQQLGSERMQVVYLEGLVKLAKERLGQDFEKK